LADALLEALVAAVMRTGVEAGIAGDLAAVGEVAPEHLVAEHAGDLDADALEGHEAGDAALGRGGLGVALGPPCLLEKRELALDEIEALDLAADLDGELDGQLAAIAGDEGGEAAQAIAGERLEVVDADGHQQAADAIA